MAAFSIEVGDVVEVTLIGGLQCQTVLNVFHYVYDGLASLTDGPTNMAAMLTDFWGSIVDLAGTGLKTLVTSEMGFHSARGQVVHPSRKPYIEITPGVVTGSDVPPTIPSNTNITIDLRTLAVGRGLTGNHRFTGLPLAAVDGNLFDPAVVVSWQAFAPHLLETLQDAALTDVFKPIVWSPRRPLDRRPVFDFTVQPQVRVSRSRTYGKGV